MVYPYMLLDNIGKIQYNKCNQLMICSKRCFMNFNQLETGVHQTIQHVSGKLSVFIRTSEGDITVDATKQRKSASVAKLFILATAFRQVEMQAFALDELVYIDKESMVGGSGIINCLTDTPAYSHRNLLELMIIVSDNTASNILLDIIGIENVNGFAKQIGCRHSRLERKFMDQDAQIDGFENYTSAQDMILLLELFSKGSDFFTVTSRHQMLNILFNQQFKDKLPKRVMEDEQVTFFHKTGELPGVEHDVAIIKYEDKTIEAAVLSEGWETNGPGQKYIAEIGRLLIDYIKS